MAQSFLHGEEHGLGLACFRVDDAVRAKPDRIERRCKKIGLFQYPEHRSSQAGQSTSDHQRGGSAMLDIGTTACHFMQGTDSQAAAGQAGIDGEDPEGKDCRATRLC